MARERRQRGRDSTYRWAGRPVLDWQPMSFIVGQDRSWVARLLLAIGLCLLAEQWALAAHVCTAGLGMPGDTADMSMPMSMSGRSLAHASARIACVVHCAAQPASAGHPPTSLAPPRFDVVLPVVPAILPVSRSARRVEHYSTVARAPPHFRTLLYCSLLI